MTRKALMLLSLLAFGAGLTRAVWAEKESPASYDLYSWKVGNDWDFSLLPVSNEHRVDAEIKQARNRLRGLGKVKEKILNMKEGDKISWQERAESGLIYPPAAIIEEISDYANAVGVKVLTAH